MNYLFLCFLSCFVLFSSMFGEDFNMDASAGASDNGELIIFSFSNYESFPIVCDYAKIKVTYSNSSSTWLKDVRSGKFIINAGATLEVEAGASIIADLKKKYGSVRITTMEGMTQRCQKSTGTVNSPNTLPNKTVTLAMPAMRVFSLAFSPTNSELLATSSSDSIIRLWNLKTSKELKQIKGCDGILLSLIITPDGKNLIGACHERMQGEEYYNCSPSIKIWNLETFSLIKSLTGHKGMISSLDLTPDGQKIVSSGRDDGTLRLWDFKNGSLLKTIKTHLDFSFVHISRDGKKMLTGSPNTLKIWDTETGKRIQTLNVGYRMTPEFGAFAPDNKLVAMSDESSFSVWDLEKEEEIASMPLEGSDSSIREIYFTENSKYLVVTYENKVHIINFMTKNIEKSFLEHKEKIFCTQMSQDKKRVASADDTGMIKIWNIN